MKKLIVLLMSSVLATGAVANADTVNVVVNPDDYVTFQGIKDENDFIGNGGVIKPVIQGTDNFVEPYFIELEITDNDTSAPLDQVAICLYDENQLDTPTKISNECGEGYGRDADNVVGDGPGFSNNYNPGAKSPYSTVAATYWPGAGSSTNKIRPLTPTSQHRVVAESAGSDVDVDVTNDVHRLSVKFQVTDLAVNSTDLAVTSTGWKVRVVAQYRDVDSPYAVTEVEATSSETYEVAYFGEITTNSRGQTGQVDFGNIIQGDKVEKGPIDTGNYRGNNISDITLSADDAFAGETALAFGADHENLGTNEFAISCGPMDGSQLGNQVFLTQAEKAVRFMTEVTDNPTFGVNTYPGNDGFNSQIGFIQADQHGCVVYVGDVPIDSYSNTMTLGITKYLPPSP